MWQKQDVILEGRGQHVSLGANFYKPFSALLLYSDLVSRYVFFALFVVVVCDQGPASSNADPTYKSSTGHPQVILESPSGIGYFYAAKPSRLCLEANLEGPCTSRAPLEVSDTPSRCLLQSHLSVLSGPCCGLGVITRQISLSCPRPSLVERGDRRLSSLLGVCFDPGAIAWSSQPAKPPGER